MIKGVIDIKSYNHQQNMSLSYWEAQILKIL